MNKSTIAVLEALLFITLAFLVGAVLSRVMKKKNYPTVSAVVLPISAVTSVMLVLRYGLSITAIRGLFLMFVLLYASYSDIATHEADDYLWVIVFALSLYSTTTVGIKSMLIGALCVIIPQLAMAWLPPHRTLGGADIKLSTALAFLLGGWRGIGAYLIGLVIAVIYMAIYNKLKQRDGKEPFALIPFLSVGALIMFLI